MYQRYVLKKKLYYLQYLLEQFAATHKFIQKCKNFEIQENTFRVLKVPFKISQITESLRKEYSSKYDYYLKKCVKVKSLNILTLDEFIISENNFTFCQPGVLLHNPFEEFYVKYDNVDYKYPDGFEARFKKEYF